MSQEDYIRLKQELSESNHQNRKKIHHLEHRIDLLEREEQIAKYKENKESFPSSSVEGHHISSSENQKKPVFFKKKNQSFYASQTTKKTNLSSGNTLPVLFGLMIALGTLWILKVMSDREILTDWGAVILFFACSSGLFAFANKKISHHGGRNFIYGISFILCLFTINASVWHYHILSPFFGCLVAIGIIMIGFYQSFKEQSEPFTCLVTIVALLIPYELATLALPTGITYAYIFIIYTLVTFLCQQQTQPFTMIIKDLFSVLAIFFIGQGDTQLWSLIMLVYFMGCTTSILLRNTTLQYTFVLPYILLVEFLAFLFVSFNHFWFPQLLFIAITTGLIYHFRTNQKWLDRLIAANLLVFISFIVTFSTSMVLQLILFCLTAFIFTLVATRKKYRLTYSISLIVFACYIAGYSFAYINNATTDNQMNRLFSLLLGFVLYYCMYTMMNNEKLEDFFKNQIDAFLLICLSCSLLLLQNTLNQWTLTISLILILAIVFLLLDSKIWQQPHDVLSFFHMAVPVLAYVGVIAIPYTMSFGLVVILLLAAYCYFFTKQKKAILGVLSPISSSEKKRPLLLPLASIPLIWKFVGFLGTALTLNHKVVSLMISTTIFLVSLMLLRLATKQNNATLVKCSLALLLLIVFKVLLFDLFYLSGVVRGVLFVALGVIGFIAIWLLQSKKRTT